MVILYGIVDSHFVRVTVPIWKGVSLRSLSREHFLFFKKFYGKDNLFLRCYGGLCEDVDIYVGDDDELEEGVEFGMCL